MNLIKLALSSLLSRKTNALLTLFSIAISVMLLLGVERVSDQTRSGFANTISGTDLIVGARSGQVNLLLFSVFHIGNPSANVSWQSYTHWRDHDQVAWSIPIALGDSYRGHPVIGTTNSFFEHFKYGQRQSLEIATGGTFEHYDEVVVGSQAARRHNLSIGDEIVIAHGTGSVSFHQHDDDPMRIVGIMQTTGTPADHALYIPLEGLGRLHGQHEHEDEHDDHQPDFSGATQQDDGHEHEHEQNSEHRHSHEQEAPLDSISAFFVGLHSQPRAIFMQRAINTWTQEPLTAIMPGATLQELWRTLSVFERTLAIVSGFVLLTGLMGMLATLLASLQERRREMAVLRSLGAGPGTIFGLLVSEAMLLTSAGILLGIGLLYGLLLSLMPWLQSSFGIMIELGGLSGTEWQRAGLVFVAGFIISCLPAWRAYRHSLTDGLSIKL
ncbi:ABC transporter permease [Aliidiomarina minuta]|uniref:ABC transporter permease n=1 Tax=Aliidiomarina minuta TaxID=880057 RepID=A0A432W487_9GAMM|nr:ABC transporter permease [Aliidiomarina minuta]RUO24270.1 ABC transporter permease [Aliidiomarina minuta]